MAIKFIDGPPPSARVFGKGSLDPIRLALIARPGVWAEVRRESGKKSPSVRGVVIALKRGTNGYPAGTFEAVTRQEGDDAVVYARAVER